MFPNMMTAEPKGRGSNSLKDRFWNDAKLRRAIRICFEFRDGSNLVYPTALRRSLELVTGENIQNFKAQNARAIAEHLCPVMFGSIYDYSMGYGGRLLGITSSNMRYSYTGIDPNTETIESLNYLNTLIDNPGTLVQSVSEEYQPTGIDLAFSSPPYLIWRSIVTKKHNVWSSITPLTNGLADMWLQLWSESVKDLTKTVSSQRTSQTTKQQKMSSKSLKAGSRMLKE